MPAAAIAKIQAFHCKEVSRYRRLDRRSAALRSRQVCGSQAPGTLCVANVLAHGARSADVLKSRLVR